MRGVDLALNTVRPTREVLAVIGVAFALHYLEGRG